MKQYLDLVKNILEHGEAKDDRTGTGTLSIFGCQTKYDLREGFPLLTTKKVLFRAILRLASKFFSQKGGKSCEDLV